MEPELEVGDTPFHLGYPVGLVAKGQDGMVIGLRDGVTVPPVAFEAVAVRLQDALVGMGMVFFHPGKECRAEIKAEGLVTIDNAFDSVRLGVEYPGEGVRPVAFVVNPVVPIGKGFGVGLVVDNSRPGVFPGWLVEMSVDNESGWHFSSKTPLFSTVPARRRSQDYINPTQKHALKLLKFFY